LKHVKTALALIATLGDVVAEEPPLTLFLQVLRVLCGS